MFFECLSEGMFGSNCYIIGDNGEGVLIDSGVDGAEILKAVEKAGLKIKYIIITHAHIDHICSLDEIRDKLGADVVVHESDATALADPRLNVSYLAGHTRAFRNADIRVKDGDVLYAGGMEFEIIHTPGHTPGGICIKTGNMIFTGDTLFKMSVGRTDLGRGSMADLLDSIRNRLLVLPDQTEVYPGHGESSTIKDEKRSNPFV